jgi:hypothetical protein
MVQPRQNHTEIDLDLFVIQKRGAIVDVEGKLKDRMVSHTDATPTTAQTETQKTTDDLMGARLSGGGMRTRKGPGRTGATRGVGA